MIALETGMRPQEIQGLKWSNLYADGKYQAFNINNSWNEKEKQFNGHLKSRRKGVFRLTLPLPRPLLQLLDKFHHCQNKFIYEHDLTNKNE